MDLVGKEQENYVGLIDGLSLSGSLVMLETMPCFIQKQEETYMWDSKNEIIEMLNYWKFWILRLQLNSTAPDLKFENYASWNTQIPNFLPDPS
jgi:hypothetical protein